MPPMKDWDEPRTLIDAVKLVEKAFRLSVVTGNDPFAAVQAAADEMGLAGGRAHDRVIEELSEAGTVTKGLSPEILLEVAAQLQHALRKDRKK